LCDTQKEKLLKKKIIVAIALVAWRHIFIYDTLITLPSYCISFQTCNLAFDLGKAFDATKGLYQDNIARVFDHVLSLCVTRQHCVEAP